MKKPLNQCADFLTASRSSSCTEYLGHPCQRSCSTSSSDGLQCYFINDRTYEILKKIFCEALKDFNSARCHEIYTNFDGNGGNKKQDRNLQKSSSHKKSRKSGIKKEVYEVDRIRENFQNVTGAGTGKKVNEATGNQKDRRSKRASKSSIDDDATNQEYKTKAGNDKSRAKKQIESDTKLYGDGRQNSKLKKTKKK